jgi:hypothetical protein
MKPEKLFVLFIGKNVLFQINPYGNNNYDRCIIVGTIQEVVGYALSLFISIKSCGSIYKFRMEEFYNDRFHGFVHEEDKIMFNLLKENHSDGT